MQTAHTNILGVRLNDEENEFLLALAESKGIQKSVYARSILREHFIKSGLVITNPAPEFEQLSQGENNT
ncbi:MAG: hypothetical protein KF758_07585 [Anaerolineales bacterium]|nr:hypothetical protein [Anaerolineales bacterium]